MTAWDGTAEQFWSAADGRVMRDRASNAAVVLREVIELAQLARRWSAAASASLSAKPDTLEKCWECIRDLDVEIAGAMDDYQRVKRELKAAQEKLEAYEKREPLVKQLVRELSEAWDIEPIDDNDPPWCTAARELRDFEVPT